MNAHWNQTEPMDDWNDDRQGDYAGCVSENNPAARFSPEQMAVTMAVNARANRAR